MQGERPVRAGGHTQAGKDKATARRDRGTRSRTRPTRVVLEAPLLDSSDRREFRSLTPTSSPCCLSCCVRGKAFCLLYGKVLHWVAGVFLITHK